MDEDAAHMHRRQADNPFGTANSGSGRTELDRSLRRTGLWVARLRTAEGDLIPCLLVDFSNDEARIVPRRPLAEGTIVNLTANVCGSRPARVAWVTKSHLGLRFLDQPIGAPAVSETPTSSTGARIP